MKVCEFDPLVEAVKKRVICIVMDSDHFELAVVRTPEMRFLFSLGSEWNSARRSILEFIKRRVPGQPLGPRWEPPVGSALALMLLAQPPLSPSLERELSSAHTHLSRNNRGQNRKSAIGTGPLLSESVVRKPDVRGFPPRSLSFLPLS